MLSIFLIGDSGYMDKCKGYCRHTVRAGAEFSPAERRRPRGWQGKPATCAVFARQPLADEHGRGLPHTVHGHSLRWNSGSPAMTAATPSTVTDLTRIVMIVSKL